MLQPGRSSASPTYSTQSASSPEGSQPFQSQGQGSFAGAGNGIMGRPANGLPNGRPSVSPRSSASPPAMTKLQMTQSTPSILSAPSDAGSRAVSASSRHGGSRTDPPRRDMDIDMLPSVDVSSAEVVQTHEMNRLLLQGDPQHITKQRVETAIRAIIDLLRVVPRNPSSPPIPDNLSHLLLRDPAGHPNYSLQRIDTYRAIHLQEGTSTKISSKKAQQANPVPPERMIYLQTAVYTSGDVPRRVYPCKRCRMREIKRKHMKEANRKKHQSSESDSSAAKNPKPSVKGILPSADYITGENADQYEPLNRSQVVEEPIWDPFTTDWRNEMVLFNSTPEVAVKNGSCEWLPFRVICYGKCHGEKLGFIVHFTYRLQSGEIIATSTTPPIRITDDHKTDITKVKPGMTPAVPRPRKGRASAASSRRQSPAPSEAESIQSVSEAGAVKQRQTPNARTKPYERPGSGGADFHRSTSTTSMPAMTSIMPVDTSPYQPFGQLGPAGNLSPAYNPQAFDFSGFDGSVFETNAYPPSASQSAPSSNLASPLSQAINLGPDNIMLSGNLPQSPTADFLNTLSYNTLPLDQQQQLPAPLFSPFGGQNMPLNHMGHNFDNIFETSSQASYPSEHTGYSTNIPDGSLFSDSGVVPDEMQGFLDLTGGEGEPQSPMPAVMPTLSPDEQTRQMLLHAIGQHQRATSNGAVVPPPQPAPTGPKISTIIPAEGPLAGGTTVAVIGMDFVPGSVVLFGDRAAKVQVVQPGFIQCQAPPAAAPGLVEVSIGGAMRQPGVEPQYYKYNMMDTDLMMLALQVKDQYAGSSNDAAYRLAQHVASRSQNNSASDYSEQSNSSPGSNLSAAMESDAQSEASSASGKEDLQATIISFLASLDEKAPGSLRRSGAINHPNAAHQTMLHIATVMGYHKLVRRLIVVGAHLDLQDVNGYTALGLASLMGKTTCVRVLIEAGASYDRPTAFGEMPLDLAKIGDHSAVEALLLSAVWSTVPEAISHDSSPQDSSPSWDTGSEIDDDNPSSGTSDVDDVSRILVQRWSSRKAKGKQPAAGINSRRASISPRRDVPRSRRSSLSSTTPQPTPIVNPTTPPEAPPPYDASHSQELAPWVSQFYPGFKLPGAVWDRIPQPITSFFDKNVPSSSSSSTEQGGWIAFPAPSWETIQKLASPEEVKLFTQAMAAAAFNAVVQSGATTATSTLSSRKSELELAEKRTRRKRRKSKSGIERDAGSSSPSPGSPKVVTHVKRDRMLYLFWLPVLLFVGFWLAITAIPIATGFCLIYARQITRAIKQRM